MTTYYAAHIASPAVFRKFTSVKKMKETLQRNQHTFSFLKQRENRYMVYSCRPADHKPFRILIIPKTGEPIWMESLLNGTWEQKVDAMRNLDMDILTGILPVFCDNETGN